MCIRDSPSSSPDVAGDSYLAALFANCAAAITQIKLYLPSLNCKKTNEDSYPQFLAMRALFCELYSEQALAARYPQRERQ